MAAQSSPQWVPKFLRPWNFKADDYDNDDDDYDDDDDDDYDNDDDDGV